MDPTTSTSLVQWLLEAFADPAADDYLKGAPVPCHVQIMYHPVLGWSAVIQYADASGRTGTGDEVVA